MVSSSTQEILLKHVCPGLGTGVALIMFASPLPAVLRCNREQCLGELNALPFAAMALNCSSWIFYALVLRDFYIYFGNMPGLLLGLFYVLTCYKWSKPAAQDVLRNVLVGGCGFFWVLALAGMAASLDAASTKTLWGAASVSVLGVYYVAPLSSVAKVVAERDSSSLHAPLCAMNIINGALWFAYGLALRDWFIALPNGIGAALNVLCIALCWAFPPTRRRSQEPQPQRGAEAVLGAINPAGNWGALRLQSFARRPGQAGGAGGDGGGGFFDVAQMRWRSGRVGSFLMRSFSRSGASSSQLQPPSSQAAAAAAVAAADGVAWKEQANGGGVANGEPRIKAAAVGDDVEASGVAAAADHKQLQR